MTEPQPLKVSPPSGSRMPERRKRSLRRERFRCLWILQGTASELSGLIMREMPAEANIRLEVTLVLPQKPGQGLRIGLRTGEKKLYVIKDIHRFILAAEANEKSTITTAVVRDVIWLYIAGELGNVIGEAYAAPQGRITIK